MRIDILSGTPSPERFSNGDCQMFRLFQRAPARYVWAPALQIGSGRIIAALMPFNYR